MNLSADLISQFVKITNDDKKNKTETIHYGTIKEQDGRFYVKLDGSELLTPIRTVASLHVDDRVTVMIKNHTAVVTGNITTPSARTSDVEALNKTAAEIEKRISEFEENSGGTVSETEFAAEKAKIVALQESEKEIKNDIDNLQKTVGTNAADIEGLKTSKLDATTASETYATKKGLDSEKEKIAALQEKDVELQNGIKSVEDKVDAHVSDIDSLKEDVDNLKTSKLDSTTAANTYATTTELNRAVTELNNRINNMGPSPGGGGNGSSGYIVSETQPSDWATGVIWFDTTGTI